MFLRNTLRIIWLLGECFFSPFLGFWFLHRNTLLVIYDCSPSISILAKVLLFNVFFSSLGKDRIEFNFVWDGLFSK